MTGQLLRGTGLAEQIQRDLKATISRHDRAPGLAVILVGDNPASLTYIDKKQQACGRIGISSRLYRFATTCSQYDILKQIRTLNEDPHTNGILVQLPLPKHINPTAIIEAIDPMKDVDGFHPYNVGRLACRNPGLRPCTPYGIIQLLNEVGETYKGRHAVIVGASNIVGRPLSLELLLAGATVTVAHRFTQPLQLQMLTLQADILIVAVGKPGFIGTPFVKEDATVIDVGITRNSEGKLVGDVKPCVVEKAAYLTPVPGGVGPMTVAVLMQNTVQAYELTLQSR